MKSLSGFFAALAAIAFLVVFHRAVLYNSGPVNESRLHRYDLLIGAVWPGPENLLAVFATRMARPERLADRGPLLGAALLIVAAALAAGDALVVLCFRGRTLSRGEHLLVAYGLGMGAVSLSTLALGLAGGLSRHSLAISTSLLALCWSGTRLQKAFSVPRVRRKTPRSGGALQNAPVDGGRQSPDAAKAVSTDSVSTGVQDPSSKRAPIVVVLGGAPFLLLSLLAAMLPTTDFDCVAYHLLGPREWFEAGRIQFLPHNVYTTFPFLTEMFHLLGMTLAGDWFLGGLIGQTTLWTFGPAGAFAVGVLANRLFGLRAGWFATLVYISTPWIYRLSSIPYVEGALLFYVTTAVIVGLRARGECSRWALVAGALAGCAAACKYTALVMVVAPVCALVVAGGDKRRRLANLAGFVCGVAIFFGPWLMRNVVWTGNPVYPLAFELFGGRNWTAEKAAHFAAGHRSHDFSIAAIERYTAGFTSSGGRLQFEWGEIPVTSDWQSGLVFAFTPFAFLYRGNRRAAVLVASVIAYEFFVFFAFTHRLDRFWLPLEPFAMVLAGAGLAALPALWRRWLAAPAVAVVLFYNLVYCMSGACGPADYFADLRQHRRLSKSAASPAVDFVEQCVPPSARVLYVGFAGVYYADREVRYNTVFDDSLFELLVRRDDAPVENKPARELQRIFAAEGVDFIAVDWKWIERYRKPGNYGYTAFVSSERFQALVEAGVLQYSFGSASAPGQGVDVYRVSGGEAKP